LARLLAARRGVLNRLDKKDRRRERKEPSPLPKRMQMCKVFVNGSGIRRASAMRPQTGHRSRVERLPSATALWAFPAGG
jgi:hypothetical protein